MKIILKVIAVFCVLVPACLSAQDDQSGCTITSNNRYVHIESSKCIITDSVEMIVTDRRGDIYTSFEFEYSKGDKITVNYAYITDMLGNVVRKLKNSDITESQYIPEATLYHDEFIKRFNLRHNTYPYKVSYSVTHVYPRFMRIGGVWPGGRRTIENGSFTAEVPKGYRLKYTSRNMAEPEKKSNEKTDRYIWNYSYTYRKPEVNESPASDPAPYLDVIPETFAYGVPGSYDSWESFGEWAWRLNQGLDQLPEGEKQKIDGLLKGITEDREKVRILYHYLQDYNRYINVKVNLGGFKSYPAEYVVRNRFGDCKALCNYMRAILSYAGIESYYTLAYLDDSVPYFNEDFPSNEFNHIITVVPLWDGTVFLECTSKNSPFNYPGTSNQGRKALVTKQSGSYLIDVPAMSMEETECVFRFNIKCPDDRTSEVSLDARLKGKQFEHFAFLAHAANKNDVEIYLRNYAFGKTLNMTEYGIDKPHRDSTFLNLRVKGNNPGSYRIFGNALVLDNITMGIPAYESPADRKSDVQLDLPRNETVIIEYELSGVNLVSVPADIGIESQYGRYSVVFSADGNTLTVTKKLQIDSGFIPLDEYGAFHNFISCVRNHEYSKIQIPLS